MISLCVLRVCAFVFVCMLLCACVCARQKNQKLFWSGARGSDRHRAVFIISRVHAVSCALFEVTHREVTDVCRTCIIELSSEGDGAFKSSCEILSHSFRISSYHRRSFITFCMNCKPRAISLIHTRSSCEHIVTCYIGNRRVMNR